MKKIKFLSAIALTLALGACDDFDLPNPPGQTNAEPTAVFENSGLVLTPTTEALNLKAYNEANKFVPVAEVTELINFPEGYDLSIDMEVGSDDAFSKVSTVATELDGNEVTVNPDFFNAAIQEVNTKKPGTYDTPVRFVAYAERETTRVRLGGLNANYGTAKFNVTTLDPAVVIEDAYYLVGDFCNWDPTKALKMNNTNGNVSPYDNPEFALKVDVTEAGLEWKVIPASSFAAGTLNGALGCNPSATSEFAGKLGESYGAGKIEVVSPMLITVNIEQNSYTVNYALEALYPLSGSTLSKPQNALVLHTDNYINYTGVTVLGSTWFCCGQPNYKGDIIFTGNDELGFEDSEDGLTREGNLVSGKGGVQLETPAGKHLYWADVNLVMLTYRITAIESISVIGSGNDWKLDTATKLTPNSDLTVWTASGVTVGDNFKLNCNGAWDIDFGGELISNTGGMQVYNVSMKGANCVATPGKYDITVDFRTFPYTVTLK